MRAVTNSDPKKSASSER